MMTIAFYSYKGGVGRSLSLANLAYVLSSQHYKKVGLIDLDIESSGLHHILDVDIHAGRDLLTLLKPQNRDAVKVETFTYPLNISKVGSGQIFLLPSKSSYEELENFVWDESVDVFLREELIPTFGKIYDLDYLFIDGRTGLSTFSAFAIDEADLVLLFCRLDRQNEFGIKGMLRVCTGSGKPHMTIVSGCPISRGYKKRITSFGNRIGSAVDAVLPYLEDLYFGEFIACKEKPRCALSKEYHSLCDKIIQKEMKQ